MKGQRRCPRGNVAAWPYMEKASRDQRDGWPGCPELSVKGQTLQGTGWSGLQLRIKPRRPFSEPGGRHVVHLQSEKGQIFCSQDLTSTHGSSQNCGTVLGTVLGTSVGFFGGVVVTSLSSSTKQEVI